jgi:hypothetical protein
MRSDSMSRTGSAAFNQTVQTVKAPLGPLSSRQTDPCGTAQFSRLHISGRWAQASARPCLCNARAPLYRSSSSVRETASETHARRSFSYSIQIPPLNVQVEQKPNSTSDFASFWVARQSLQLGACSIVPRSPETRTGHAVSTLTPGADANIVLLCFWLLTGSQLGSGYEHERTI